MIKKILVLFIFLALLNNYEVYAFNKQKENYRVKKIFLGKFGVRDNKAVIPPGSPNWPKINRYTITVDDNDNVYVLDSENKSILLFDPAGNAKGKINLPIYAGYLEVSGDGTIFYVLSDYKFYLINKEGKILKIVDTIKVNDAKDIEREEIIVRRCRDKFVDGHWRGLYDNQLNLINTSKRRGFIFLPDDSQGNSYGGANTPYLIKLSKNVKKVKKIRDATDILEQIWKKKIHGYEKITGILGIDGKDNVYLFARPERKKQIDFVKVNRDGELMASSMLPKEAPLLTKEEREEWDERSSEESFESFDFYKVNCKGSVFAIYSYQELPSKTYLRWLNKGEYYIIKFEKTE